MSDIETRLDGALKTIAPARDPMFRVQVLLRRERAALHRRLWTVAAMVLAGSILAALGAEVADHRLRPGPEQTLTIVVAALVLAAILAISWAAMLGLIGPWRARASAMLQAMAGVLPWR